MNRLPRKGRIGLLAVFAVLLMPLLGVGNASAIEVNDQVTVLVPDLQEFAQTPEEHIFTCRAITDHAVWLVQDTSRIDNSGGNGDTTFVPKIVWGSNDTLNLVDPADFAALTASFEDNVWGTVTADCGVPEDLNSDGKVVVILAAIPTRYSASSTSTVPMNIMHYADLSYNEIEGEAMEVFYVNIHSNTLLPFLMPAAVEMREWNLANGLADLIMISSQKEEERWLIRGISQVMQYRCFGFTHTSVYEHGAFGLLKGFANVAYIELINSQAANAKYDHEASKGQQFLWFMYLAQREGDDIISTIAMDTENVGMLSIALAIDPAADEETAVNDHVVPLYFDWLVCNLHNDFRSDYAGGIYMYDFLEGTTQENWSHALMPAAFTKTFNSFPIEGWIAPLTRALKGPVWASQYCRFNTYTEDWVTFINGQYSDGSGANSAVNSRWEGLLIKCDDAAGEFISVEPFVFDEFYNTSFTLSDPNTYIILTNNNPGGAMGMRYYISNDEVAPETETALHQNGIMSQYITVYTALVDADTDEIEGYDWVGPVFKAQIGDSTQNIKMSSFYGGLFTGIFPAWASGTYTLSFSGFDSTGHTVQGIREVAVGFADTDVSLEIDNVFFDVPKGGAPSGSMITLAETSTLGLAMESGLSIADIRSRMTGIIVGPVAIPAVTGTLSFNSSTNAASVYRYTNEGWVKLDSWMQNGKIFATVEEGGIYALGEGFGVFSPEIPAQLVLGGNAPNPFTAQTAISFGLPVGGNVRVNVFDMTGRLVTTIANEEMAAANHTIIWDGTDAAGSPVGAGVYFCRLETAGQVLTQKMLKVQ
ncbi:MAG: T9SS type A sorting domain-containing protein [Candidatus Sabulitectum sp.]|nr:T9SS type A sorting domain-containing protein [Candidatus Sabulitectum sp.]